MANTYYEVLDLDRDASPEEIKAAFRGLARACHPDVTGNDPEASERFRALNQAYQVLSDPQRKRDYDRTLPQKSYPLRHLTPEKVWREATDVVLLRSDRYGPLNQAMKAAVPLLIDEDSVILAMRVHDRHLSGHLETASLGQDDSGAGFTQGGNFPRGSGARARRVGPEANGRKPDSRRPTARYLPRRAPIQDEEIRVRIEFGLVKSGGVEDP